MENLENFKRFEQNLLYRNQAPEEEVIRLIKKEEYEEIQKSVLQTPTPTFTSKDSLAEPQELPESETARDSVASEPTKPKPIKAYPKNLYAATPFSAYYDKEPVGTHDCLVQDNPINKDSFQDLSQPKESQSNAAPSTIFYYGKIKSTRPMQPKEMQQIQESLSNEDSKTNPNEPPLQAEPAALNHIIKQVIQEFMESQSPQTSVASNVTQEIPAQEVIKESPKLPNPPQEKTEIPFHYTPSFTTNKIPSYGYGLEKESERKANVVESQNSNVASLLPKETLLQESSQTIETPVAEVISLFDSKRRNAPPKQNASSSAPMQSVQAESCVPFSKQTPTQSSHNEDSSTLVKRIPENEKILSTLEISSAPQNAESKDFVLPKLEFLQAPKEEHIEIDEGEIDRKINDLLSKLRMFKIEGDIVRTYSGPIVTTFEFRPSPNVKVSRILTLQDDLAMALRAKTIRIQAPVPGKDVVGIEIPNIQIETIYLREILENPLFINSASPLTLALGKDIVGNPFVTDLKKLPHLLIAGTTGSGKSVGINAMILSLLYKNSPKQLKLIMIDPKMLEFSIYNEIPHLLTPVITQPKKAIIALDNTVKEMERRYTLMSEAKIKNIEGYNQKAEIEGFEPFPYIVVIIDELADLMMSGGKEAEVSISRLAQMARASGIHLIVATQRPSVDVVTGLIKANLPSRISYKVGQKIDSKVILDSFGAESLLGRGDMLFTPPGGGIVRLHAPWSTETEIEKIVEFIKSQCPPQYDENFMPNEDEILGLRVEGETDELYEEAKRIILNDGKTSISYIQRRLGIGYNKAANIIEQMQARGFLSEPNSKGVREILGD
ncbi:DNA translocase FtsK [Helicobacter sp.]|uniref:DNA translocase FtsK n=1 Tax=Helicobacter sp. TaxID=218 RepID=UPI00199AAD8B|nr:DNA translocase FtsK [Helicobacter sp.]MBD5164663.1 DNA translocase FtsK [Helicobacter sp.]